jgi:hypothetical protein
MSNDVPLQSQQRFLRNNLLLRIVSETTSVSRDIALSPHFFLTLLCTSFVIHYIRNWGMATR